jgi:antibiotic biosynthesis monooxygenase (ABM) superfamily enzyme
VGPRMEGWPLPLRTLAVTAVLVPLMVFLLLPTVQRLLAAWLRPRRLRERPAVSDEALPTASASSKSPDG